MFGGDNWVNYYYTLDTLRLAVDLRAATASPAAAVRARSSRSSTSVRSPTTRATTLVDPDLEAGPLAGADVRHRSRADPDDVARRALRAQVGRLRDRGGVQLHAERGRGLRRQQPGLRQRARHVSARPRQPGAAGGRARLRRHRGAAPQAAGEPLVGGRQLSLQQAARQLVRHRQLGRSRRQPAAELRPVVQPSLLFVRHAGQRRRDGPARHRSSASVQGAGHLRFAVGHDGRRQRHRSRAASRARRS